MKCIYTSKNPHSYIKHAFHRLLFVIFLRVKVPIRSMVDLLLCLTKLFFAYLTTLREIHFFCLFVWIPSNPEIAYNWKKQTSLPLEHPDYPWQFLFSLWPLCFCIWLLRFSSHLYFSVHFTVSNPPTQILHSLPLPCLPMFFFKRNSF